MNYSHYSFQDIGVGVIALMFCLLVCIFLSFNLKEKKNIFLVAFIIKFFLLISNTWFWEMPTDDYEGVAFDYAQSSGFLGGLLSEEKMYGGYYLAFCTLVYELIGRQPIVLEIFNLLASLCMLRLVLNFYERRCFFSTLGIFALCFLPSYQIYSVVILKESFIIFFLTVGAYFYLQWGTYPLKRFFAINLIGIAGIWHEPLFLIPLTLLFLETIAIWRWRSRKFAAAIFLPLVLLALVLVDLGGGSLLNFVEKEGVAFNELENARASYIAFASSAGATGSLRLVLSIICFFAAPIFPWGVSAFVDLYAVFFNAFYGFLFYTTIRLAWKRHNWGALKLLLALMAGIAIYSLGTVNYGTSIRHREKFLPLIVLLIVVLEKRSSQKNYIK